MVGQALPDEAVGARLGHEIEPSARRLVLVLDEAEVTVMLDELGLEKRMGHGPDQPAVLDAHEGSRVREHAVLAGGIRPVGRRFTKETGHVEVGQEGVGRGDEVAAVAEFLPVGAVR